MNVAQEEIKQTLGDQFDKIAYLSYIRKSMGHSKDVTNMIIAMMIGLPIGDVEKLMEGVDIYDKHFPEDNEYWRAWVK